MWAVIGKSKKNPKNMWVSGLFLQKEKAEEYLKTVAGAFDDINELKEIPAEKYPVFFFFDFEINELAYVTKLKLVDKLFNLKKVADDDHQYGIYFSFTGDYHGFIPGEKYFNFISHQHVDNRYLKKMISQGITVDTMGGHFFGIYRCDNCSISLEGQLSKDGYLIPPNWEVVQDPENHEIYFSVCSENCKQKLLKQFS